MILKRSIERLMQRENLNSVFCRQVLEEMLNPAANQLQIAALLVLLRNKPETPEELSTLVHVLREKMIKVDTDYAVLDIVGTGGDGFNTVNISTGSALLAACCGIKIAKHGNHAASSLSGSADVLQALGINIKMTPQKISQCIDEIGIGFCYGPYFHPYMQVLRYLRKQLSVPTTFNLLGPLLNPANPNYLILGVANEDLLSVMADVLILTDAERALIVHGGGLDEISCVYPVKIVEVNKGKINEWIMDPMQYGFNYCTISDLRGGDANVNAALLRTCFKGKKGPLSDTLVLNAAIALYLYGLFSSMSDALLFAKEKLESGKVLQLLKNWIEFSYDQ